MASLRETFRFWTLSRGDCVAIEEWLRESGLSLGDFFASFINFCAKVANRAQDPGTKNRTPEEGRILDIVRAYPTSVNDLISAMKWYYEAKYEVDGQAWGNIPIREGYVNTREILAAQAALYEQLFSPAESAAHDPTCEAARAAAAADAQEARRQRRLERRAERREEHEEQGGVQLALRPRNQEGEEEEDENDDDDAGTSLALRPARSIGDGAAAAG